MSHKISTISQNHNNNSSGFFDQQNTATSSNSGLFKQLNFGLRRLFKLPLDFYSCMVSSGKLSLRRSSTLQISALVSSFALILAISAILAPLYNRTDITEAATGTAKESSLSLNVTNSTASVDLGVVKDNGSFASSTNPISFNITTTNYTGYTLSIKNSKTTTDLVNTTANGSYTSDSNKYATLSSITSATSSSTFSADDANTGNNYNGKYGLLYSKLNSSANTSYQPSPTSTTATTLDKTTAANSSANTYTIGIGARASYTQPAGTYTGTYALTVVANSIAYAINYNADSTDSTIAGIPTAQASTSFSASSITLSSNTPTRTGYTFSGWCSKVPTNNSTANPSCSGDTYAKSATYYFNYQEDNSSIQLYAIWKLNSYTITVSFSNATSVSFVATGYTTQTATASSNQVTLYHNVPYTITMSFASNYEFNSWSTTTNGALTSTSTNPTTYTVTGAATLAASGKTSTLYLQNVISSNCTTTATTAEDSRDGQKYTIQKLSDGKCWMLDNLALGAVTLKQTLSTSNTNMSSSTSFSLPSSGSINSYTVAQINTASYTKISSGGYAPGKYGAYYNYCAASAGTICSSSNSSNASYDICPKGWRMPTGGSSGEYQTLYNKYGSYSTFVNALRTPLSGRFDNDWDIGQGRFANFWSSTRYDDLHMHTVTVDATVIPARVKPANYLGRAQGPSVRCVLK